MTAPEIPLYVIGRVESPLRRTEDAPLQGDEGAPEAWIVVRPEFAQALDGLNPPQDLIVLTWLHLAERDRLMVHPRGDRSRPMRGIFATRSPDRPNPIGLHEVQVVARDGLRLLVRNLEAIDGTPVLDLKPALGPVVRR